ISADPGLSELFLRASLAMANLTYPYMISDYALGQTAEGPLFFLMDYLDGMTLHYFIHFGPTLGPAYDLCCVIQMCDQLAYAHIKGIVHRDIKPINVRIDTEERVKVADSGLARLLDNDTVQSGTTMTGVVVGTPDYMAPEQRRGLHVDHRADVYAL